MTLVEKILEIMKEIQYLSKDDKVEFGSTKYKALSEEKVTTIMREQLIKHKIVVFPIAQTASRVGTITHVDVIYRMVNTEDPNDFIEIASCGDGADTQDKGSGKAMTYAYKYMWLRTFALPTGEDPDKISSAELDAKEIHVCEECGGEIKDGKKNDGSVWSASDIAAYTKRKFGRSLCTECAKKENTK